MTSSPRLTLADLGSLNLQLTPDRMSQTPVPTPQRVTPASIRPNRQSRRPQTPVTDTMVIASVTFYNEQKNFGFAEGIVNNKRERIFFHANSAVEVTGTYNAPKLTGTRKEQHVITNQGSRSSDIVIRYERTERGLRAISWGLRPRINPLADMVTRDGGLARFIGGTVATAPNYGSKSITRYEGTLADGSMSLTEMTIVITNAIRHEPDDRFGTRCNGPVSLSFNLTEAYLDPKLLRSADHYTHVVIVVRTPGSSQERRISLRMPSN